MEMTPFKQLENKEEVRIYRLSKLEQNQEAMSEKLDIINSKLDKQNNTQDKQIDACRVRIDSLELRARRVNKIMYLLGSILAAETFALIFAVISKQLGL